MSDDKDIIQLCDDIEIIGPGHMLKDARESLGLSVEQVAEQLRLRVTVVKDIECEQFDTSVPETFIRGYLKNYAKLVEVDYDDVKTSYDAIAVAKQQGAEMKSFSQGKRKKAENNRLMFACYALFLGLVSLTILWWYQESSAVDLAMIEQANSNQNEFVEANIESNQATNEAEVALTLLAYNSPVTEQTEQSTPPVEPVANSADAANSLALTKTNHSPASNQDQNAETEANISRLVFSFSGDCWVNVFDATGERLAWGVKKADYVMSLQGVAPFNITLGKPELVAINYNEQPIDMSDYQIGQIAKFSWPVPVTGEN
ncbi:RodZ domain-containing protein [Thalassotalea aquiviva]|uniref:RodZ domain-containing protein n=1 Tax=Thalassotalea aquiviva TaxID=3242415 RepID=UPI00352B28EE